LIADAVSWCGFRFGTGIGIGFEEDPERTPGLLVRLRWPGVAPTYVTQSTAKPWGDVYP